METLDFKAFALNGELDLNKLAASLGITKHYRWEEPMLLNPVTLTPVEDTEKEHLVVYLYYFGGIVFVNCSEEIISSLFGKLAKISDLFRNSLQLRYKDDYALKQGESEKTVITNDYAVMPALDQVFVDIVCFVIAKSVALDQIENRMDSVLDEVEELIEKLRSGKLGITDEKLAKLASSILTFKYASISYIMVLDKPEITWDHPEANRLYKTMANLFELSQRFQEIQHKSDTLKDVLDVVTGLSHAQRSTRLEWIIIILIFVEILMSLFWKH
ncbi:MAG: RMD1 family protein [Desulfuromonadaceae bacterium]|nr:RMD1 family protein [Desulfuromonadaceae bacterium]MDD5105096.1 RMD1 family protein [Desulfuromonadaceae bacterium]